MQRITYLNQFNEKCIRHGSVKTENGKILFLPNDTTKTFEVSKEKVIDISEAEQIEEFYELTEQE